MKKKFACLLSLPFLWLVLGEASLLQAAPAVAEAKAAPAVAEAKAAPAVAETKAVLVVPKGQGATTPAGWFDDYNLASAEAKRLSRPMIVLFTGSDWCGYCIKLRKEVFDTTAFQQYAAANLVLVFADSPARTKLPEALVNRNRMLGQMLGKGRGVPESFLLAPDSTLIGKIGGYTPDYLPRIQKMVQAWRKKAAGK